MTEFCYICDKFDFRCSGGGGSGGREGGGGECKKGLGFQGAGHEVPPKTQRS